MMRSVICSAIMLCMGLPSGALTVVVSGECTVPPVSKARFVGAVAPDNTLVAAKFVRLTIDRKTAATQTQKSIEPAAKIPYDLECDLSGLQPGPHTVQIMVDTLSGSVLKWAKYMI